MTKSIGASKWLVVGASLCLSALASPWARANDLSDGPAEQAWSEALRRDARALHDAMLNSHPGAVDEANPGFMKTLGAGLAKAESRARGVSDYAGYWWALREYVASFEDNHVFLRSGSDAPARTRWPGFLLGYDGEHYRVAVRAGHAKAPPLGAELVGCDGQSADDAVYDRTGRYVGRWALAAVRMRNAGYFLLDQGNPFTDVPRVCSFRSQASTTRYRLQWFDVAEADVPALIEQARRLPPQDIGYRWLRSGGLWLRLGSFDGRIGSFPQQHLTALLETLSREQSALDEAPLVVLDVRANDGGSSHWASLIAQRLWDPGRIARAAAEVESGDVEWRVSDANIAHLRKFHDMFNDGTEAGRARADVLAPIIEGLSSAQAAGKNYWTQSPRRGGVGAPPAAPGKQRAGAVFVLTDHACASACLDALDLWKSLGAIHVGQVTAADTQYMDLRFEALPSGHATLALPIKVIRDRPRAPNVPHVPQHVYPNDMRDDVELRNWITGLVHDVTARSVEPDRVSFAVNRCSECAPRPEPRQ